MVIMSERITGELFLQSPELLVERQLGWLREIDEDKAFPKCNMDRHQPKSLFVEVEEILLVRNVHHVALVAEHPPVEFAREVFFVAALHECARVGKLLTQFVSAVGAGLVESSDLAVATPEIGRASCRNRVCQHVEI